MYVYKRQNARKALLLQMCCMDISANRESFCYELTFKKKKKSVSFGKISLAVAIEKSFSDGLALLARMRPFPVTRYQ